jgi:hypothetical protein
MILWARAFDRWTRTRPWWWWPAFLVALAVATWTAALVLEPVGEQTWLAGQRFGEDCAFLVQTGKPCPNCGMTRSFLHMARIHAATAFRYNPAGAALFTWITAAGIVGLVRLVRQDRKALTPPWQLLVGWTLVWVIGLFLVPYALRLAGFNPLPGG